MTAGEKIRQRRIELGLSQEALAKAVGYSGRSLINKIELNVNGVPRWKMKPIADALRTTTEELFGADEETTELYNDIMSLNQWHRAKLKSIIRDFKAEEDKGK